MFQSLSHSITIIFISVLVSSVCSLCTIHARRRRNNESRSLDTNMCYIVAGTLYTAVRSRVLQRLNDSSNIMGDIFYDQLDMSPCEVQFLFNCDNKSFDKIASIVDTLSCRDQHEIIRNISIERSAYRKLIMVSMMRYSDEAILPFGYHIIFAYNFEQGSQPIVDGEKLKEIIGKK